MYSGTHMKMYLCTLNFVLGTFLTEMIFMHHGIIIKWLINNLVFLYLSLEIIILI